MIGLGRMGTNMVRRLLRAGHQCVVYDLQPEAVQALVKEGAVGTTSLEDFANKLKKPREVDHILPPHGGDCEEVLTSFAKAGIDIDALAAQLQDEGARGFVKSWKERMACIASQSKALK